MTITTPIGNAAIILTDWRLFIELSANNKAIGSKISNIHYSNRCTWNVFNNIFNHFILPVA